LSFRKLNEQVLRERLERYIVAVAPATGADGNDGAGLRITYR
jgi:hypothetical protein